jgi:hypothetical protein
VSSWNVDDDKKMEQLLKTLFSSACNEICKLAHLASLQRAINCDKLKEGRGVFEQQKTFDQLSHDELFVPLRNRRAAGENDQGSPQISAEKKAKLDVLANDLFVPNRGRRQLVRKSFLRLEPYPLGVEKRNNIELDNIKDFFVPHRGKRQRTIINDILSDNFLPQRGKKAIDDIFADNFLPQRGKKAIDEILSDNFFPQRGKKSTIIIPKDQPWTQNINSYDRHMIDRLHDLNLLMMNSEVWNCFEI